MDSRPFREIIPMNRLLQITTNLFPVWVVLGGVLALIYPPWFIWFRGQAIVWGLAVIMLGMGITLRLEEFQRVLKCPARLLWDFSLNT
jgi:bile acid:Na+ symporter, BASS family